MHTHVTVVLDSSGSMEKIEADTKGGFNSFIDEQADEDGSAAVSLYNFNSGVDRVYHGKDVEDAPHLTDENYTPSGRTALYDAIVTAIDETEAHLEDADEDAENVIVVVLTDGMENASETSIDAVQDSVEEKRDADWEFLFIGANQDAVLTAESMGMSPEKSLNMDHDGEGTNAAVQATSRSISRARQNGQTDGFLDEDRREQDSDPRA